jgi:coenzyme F420 hydrogenase subunit beta
MASKEIYAEPTYLEYGFGELEHDVLKDELCCFCGTCVAFCPKIEQKDDRPELIAYDPLCGLCYAYCPRSFLDVPFIEKKIFGRERSDEPLGIYKKAVSAKASNADITEVAQDGGVVTALLAQALESGLIDCAVCTGRDDDWRPVPRIATSVQEIIDCAGTKYTISPSVVGVQMAIDEGYEKIGFVGTPCQIQALRKIQLLDEPYEFGQEKIALLVGLFCMENFNYERLMNGLIEGSFGLKPQDVRKFEIQKGMLRAVTKDGTSEVPLAETDEYVWKGCGPCFDFTAELADISVGSVGSRAGWSTALIRTELGERVYNDALKAGAFEETEVSERGLALVEKLGGGKLDRFAKKTEELRERGVNVQIER